MISVKWISGFERLYSASNEGRVFSHVRGKTRELTPSPRGDGYFNITIGGRAGQSRLLHRVIAETFLENPDKLPQVNHKDGNKANNAADNLEWSTDSNNKLHAYATGLRKPTPQRGEKSHLAKLSETQVKDIRERYAKEGVSSRKLASEYNVSHFAILQIIRRRTWAHVN